MTEPANLFDVPVDQDLVMKLMDRFIDAIHIESAVDGIRPVENICALHSLALVTLASFPPGLDATVDSYVDNVADNMRAAIAGHRALRDLPEPPISEAH